MNELASLGKQLNFSTEIVRRKAKKNRKRPWIKLNKNKLKLKFFDI